MTRLDSIYRRDRGVCWICLHKVALDEASLDHLIPRSESGSDTGANLAVAHSRCNTVRGTLPVVAVELVRSDLPAGSSSDTVRQALSAAARAMAGGKRSRQGSARKVDRWGFRHW